MNKKNILKIAAIVAFGGVSAWLLLPGGDQLTPEQRAAREARAQTSSTTASTPRSQPQSQQNQAPDQPREVAPPARRNITVQAEDLANEIVIRSSNPDEALQHAELALSVRNQQLMTRRATMLAEQRKAELEAFSSQAEFTRIQERREQERRERQRLEVLTGDGMGMSSVSGPKPSQPPEISQREGMPLERIRLLGIFRADDGEWVARVSRPGAIERVRNGYVIDGSIEVAVYEDRIRLTRNQESIELYL